MNRKAVWIGLTSAALVAGVSVVAVLSRATAQSVETGSSVRAAEWETGVEHTLRRYR